MKLKPLEHPDSLHLDAARGWIELGNHLEANEELERITPRLRVHPDVLQCRFMIYGKAHKREAALEVARTLVSAVPDSPTVWRQQASALRQMPGGGAEQAWNALLPAAD